MLRVRHCERSEAIQRQEIKTGLRLPAARPPVERMTGKERLLPEISEQWPAKDNTRTPHARP
jgi:hypothetical protein